MAPKKSNKAWGSILLRGIVAIVFAFLAFFWTGLTLEVLVLILGIYLLIEALLSFIATGVLANEHGKWWLMLLNGLFSLIIAIIIFSYPGLTLLILVYFIGIWAIITGLVEFVASFTAPWAEEAKVAVGVAGVISIILGLIILFNPAISIIVMMWLVGIYLLVFGISMIAFAMKLKK